MPGLMLLLLHAQRPCEPDRHDGRFRARLPRVKTARSSPSPPAKCVRQLAEFQHRRGRNHHLPPAVGILHRVEPRERPNPSQIYGTLQANGIVVLLNSSGFYFGPNSFVSAAGLVVSTANCAPPENSGGSWEFNGPPPLASIVNYGQIKIGNGGSTFLIADQVENHGTSKRRAAASAGGRTKRAC